MSSLIMPSGSSCLAENSVLPLSLPLSFVEPDDKYLCAKCHGVLREPKQTPCGHRLCQPCIETLFVNKSIRIPCPAAEADCTTISMKEINPDYSVMREMKKLKVYCINRQHGCKDEMLYDKLKDHISFCKYGNKSCPHCDQHFTHEEIESHIAECPNRNYTCKFMKYGCQFEALKENMVKHESDYDIHTDMLLKYVANLESENDHLSKEQKKLCDDLNTINSRLVDCLKDNSELKTSMQRLIETQEQSEKCRTSLEERLESHEAACQAQNSELLQRLESSEQKELASDQPKALASSSSSTLNGPADDLRKQLDGCRQSIRVHGDRLTDFELRFQCLETTNYDGVLVWKIGEYRERKRQAVDGQILSLYSQPFYTSRYGYRMCARVYLNGDGVGRGSHMSLFFVIMQGDYDDLLPWPFRQRVTMSILDQRHNRRHLSDTFRPDPSSTSFQKPTTPMNVASGCPKFVQHSVLETADSPYLQNNYIYVKISVDTSDLQNP